MTIQTNEPSPGGANVEGGIRILDSHIEDIAFSAKGDPLDEPIRNLLSAVKEIEKFPRPVSAAVGNLPGLGPVHLLHLRGESVTFYLVVGGMRVELTYHQEGEWSLEVYGSGPHALDEHGLAELDKKVRRIKEFFFGKDGRIELKSCSIALYCHNSPDLSDTNSTSDTYSDFIYGRITRAKSIIEPPHEPDPYRGLSSRYLFGKDYNSRRVKISVSGGKHASSLNSEELARLKENVHYQDDREIICVTLVFGEAFVHHVTEGTAGGGNDLNLPAHLRYLVRATLGDGALPCSFFRVAKLESRGLPDSLRPNSAAWERVCRGFLDTVAASLPSPGVKANP